VPEEIEVPTEHLHETLNEHAHGGDKWVSRSALSAAMLAVAAAVAALLAGHHANEAMLEQMKATDNWALYQAKGIKSALVENEVDLLAAFGKPARDSDQEKITRYKAEQKVIEDQAKDQERLSDAHMRRHGILARSVTMYQVAIALAAIAVLSRKKPLWFLGLALGIGGTVFFIQAL
jgi:uncharacterized protein DUF4337